MGYLLIKLNLKLNVQIETFKQTCTQFSCSNYKQNGKDRYLKLIIDTNLSCLRNQVTTFGL